LVPVLAQMELAGVTVDAELLENKDKEFALKLANLEAQAKKKRRMRILILSLPSSWAPSFSKN
jgi:DNA polymerase I-like protein with 3'-5' exonuclease and polymerase domains